MDGISEFAKLLKDRDNRPYLGPQVGVVASPPPGLKVRLGSKVVLDKSRLIVAAHVLEGYTRDVEITGLGGEVTLVKPPPPEIPTESETWGITGTEITGSSKYTDGLKVGDEVILIPSTDEQTYFLIDKAVRL